MKVFRSNSKAALLLALTLIVGAQTFAGTKDGGGGGNIQQSNRSDLEEIVNQLDRHFWEISDKYNFGNSFQLTRRQLKPALLRVSRIVLGADHFTINDSVRDYLGKLEFEIQDECFEGNEPRDASTLHEKNAPVCISAKRLARFPKSSLRVVLLPLIFHEVAHQFGLGEAEANALQALVDLHLKYRPIYLSAIRARFACAFASKTLNSKQKLETLSGLPNFTGGESITRWPVIAQRELLQTRNSCVARAISVGESLERLYDGGVWETIPTITLSTEEIGDLLDYERYPDRKFTFVTLKRSLNEPPITGYTDCAVCKAKHLDPYYIMMLGAKASMEYIDREVGRLQDQIVD